LLPLLAAQTEVLPTLFAIAAAAEGSHTTYAGITPDGFRLILSHERGQAGRTDFLAAHQPSSQLHRHGLAARIICTLAGSTQKLADHDAFFSTGGTAQHSNRDLRLARTEIAADSSPFSFTAPAALTVAAPTQLNSDPPYHQRLTVPELAQTLRTTVLLI
jgi:hypothetical protein